MLFVEDEPSRDLMERMKSVEGVEAVTPQDFLHHCVQRLPPTVVFISNDPAGPSRQVMMPLPIDAHGTVYMILQDS